MKESPIVEAVQEFWNAKPCGADTAQAPVLTPEYFHEVEAFRYQLEPHILEVVPFAATKGKRVLEIGCGLGTDGARFAAAGADYQAVDLTEESLRLAKANFTSRGLSGTFTQTNAETLPFPRASFDVVYSHGVIHHIPQTEQVVSEMHRVLKPGGKAIVMVYHRHSYNYYVNILLFRRLGALLLLLPGGTAIAAGLTGEKREILEAHRHQLHDRGLSYLRTQEFLSANTDGPGNPLSKVYSQREATDLFRMFNPVKTQVRYLNRRRIPFIGKWLPSFLDRRWGWHLYIEALKCAE
jgi:2-polyprenyl-3-methyl-5-hydroxy-6-metoxy-1,4-benzoquinol methylase